MALNVIDLRNLASLPTYGTQRIPIIGAIGDDSEGYLRFVIGANSNTLTQISVVNSYGVFDDRLFQYSDIQNTLGFIKESSFGQPEDRLIKLRDTSGQETIYSEAGDNVYLLKIQWTDQTIREALVAIVVRPEYRDFYDYFDANTYRGISNNLFRGSEFSDTVLPTGDSDQIFGLGGIDWLEGGGGSDTIYGGDGDDILSGGSDRDSVYGGDGNDFLGGGSSADRIEGGNGNDLYFLGTPEDTYFDSGGVDTLSFDTRSDDVSDSRFDAVSLYMQRVPSAAQGYYDLEIVYRYMYAGAAYAVSAKVLQMYLATDASILSPFAIENFVDRAAQDKSYFAAGGLEGSGRNDFIAGTRTGDSLLGYAGADLLDGGEGNDRLDGGGDSDMLNAGPGDDTLIGGSGIDTVAYSGRRSSYTLTRTDANWESRDTRSSSAGESSYGDGFDRLIEVERLKFLDSYVAIDIDGSAGKAYRLYKASFNRDPTISDKQGLGFWIAKIDQGMDLLEVAARFIDSNEFRSIYGSSSSNSEFLTKLYQNILGRQPEVTGFDWWLNQMATNPEKTRAKVLADFSESPENMAGVIGLIASGIPYEPWPGG